MSEETKPCPQCEYPYAYAIDDTTYTCPDCNFEWSPNENQNAEARVKDSNDNLLQNGDAVVVIKDLPVKGFSKPIKAGTKVKNIRLVDGDHNIDCKIDGFGAMALKSEFVRKVN
jgi:protein PhnA